MSQSVLLQTALCLPAPDIEALIQGRMIVAMPRKLINQGQKFALYTENFLPNFVSPEHYYHSSFLPIAQKVLTNSNSQLDSQKVLIQAWAKCELCQILDASQSFDILSKLSIWKKEAFQQKISQRPYLFLAYLRVYMLLEPIQMPVYTQERHFVPLPYQLRVSDATPVLSDRVFAQRKHQLENLQPPVHPELEELQSALASLAVTNSAVKQLDEEIKVFLGWSHHQSVNEPQLDLDWINDITALGRRSKEEDEAKSNYQAGTEFENIVRKSLECLGFTVDYFHRGGAGGVDVFCSQPYPLIGECKAGKKIPNDTAVQLLNLGTLRLKNQELFKQATKLIIGSGEPTTQLQDAAKVHGMTIINPETIEKLVRLQSTYRNSIDLFKLKQYLKAGQSDEEIEKYIEQVYQELHLRSHLVKAVKELTTQESDSLTKINPGVTVTEIRVHYNATHNPKQTDDKVRDLLIELSSPLTGYLGRDVDSNQFYYLRDLPISK